MIPIPKRTERLIFMKILSVVDMQTVQSR
jgi:hypothetical protein